MIKLSNIAVASVLAMTLASPVLAQSTVTGIKDLNDRIDDIQTDVKDDMDLGTDAERFGPLGVPQGWRGSLVFSTSSTDGNTNTREAALGARLTYGVGSWTHLFGVAAEYGRENGVVSSEDFFATYEANRYFTETFYVFGLGRYQYDGVGGTEHEGFLGVGPGVRVINNKQTTWRLQAGPGVLYTETNLGASDSRGAGIVSSRFYHAFTDTLSLTNDTDVLLANNVTIATNDLGLNVKLNERLSTRFSYRTDYDDSRAIETDSKVGLSLVLGF